jgi:GAF domain-containing protein
MVFPSHPPPSGDPPAPAEENDFLLLEALKSLNQIGSTINQISPKDQLSVAAGLNLIVESAIKVLPGASAVIYTYDEEKRAFDPTSRVSAGEWVQPVPGDEPRPDGMGMRAIDQRRRVLSYDEPDLGIHPVKVHAGAKTVVCFPLIVAGQPLGVLYVYLHENRPFSQLELLMLENFTNQAAMAIYQTRRLESVQRDLARKEDELFRLRYAGLLISSRPRLEETLDSILHMALEVTNAQYGIFRLMDKSGQRLLTTAVAGEHLARPLVESLPIDEHSIMGWVALHQQPVCITDLLEEPWSHIYYRLDANLVMRSELAVPLISASGRLEGVLNLESPIVGAFSEEDKHLLQALATQAVIAIQEARLLDALQEVAKLLLVQPCQMVLIRLAELACDLLNAAASAIWTLEESWLVLRVASQGDAHDPRIPLEGSLAGQAVLARSPVTAEDVRSDPRFNRQDLARANGWTRALVVPLLAGDERQPLGAFSVYSKEDDPGRFAESEWDKKVLTCLAHYAVLAVHNETHQEALRLAQEQQAVAETFAAIGDIAANLLHKLNNRVGTIPVRVQGIRDKCQPALAADAYLSTNLIEIERSANEAMEAVRENLSLLHPIYLVPINVAACVSNALHSVNLPPGVVVKTEGLENLPAVVAGEHNLALVFNNLFENACSAMADVGVGTISIAGTAQKAWVEIVVSDNGPGIPADQHDRIFEFNFSGRGKTRPGKLGFGLWWVKTLMRRLGGSVQVESDGVHGTAFRLRLPRAEAS